MTNNDVVKCKPFLLSGVNSAINSIGFFPTAFQKKDLIQDAWVKIILFYNKKPESYSYKTWIKMLAFFATLDSLRNHIDKHINIIPFDEEIFGENDNINELFITLEISNILPVNTVNQRKWKKRTLRILKDISLGKSRKDLAKELKFSQPRITQILKNLRIKLINIEK